jgi:arylsulfatase A-like enzyme
MCHVSAIVLLGCFAVTGCSKDREPPRLVVLYATCTLNKNYLSPYDSSIEYTPNFAEFAAKGLTFTKHQTETGLSGPAYAAIFSGTHAYTHGAYYHPKILPEEMYLVSEAFADNGYESFFWAEHGLANASLGYGQGVKPENIVIQARAGEKSERELLTGDDARFVSILNRLREDPEYLAYVQFNFTMTHGPYYAKTTPEERATFGRLHPEFMADLTESDIERFVELHRENPPDVSWNAPEAFRQMNLSPEEHQKLVQVIDLCYRAAVSKLDQQFGAFLNAIQASELMDESLIVVTADHGEMLYRDNALFLWTHGMQLSPEVLNVPLMIHGPKSGVQSGVYDGVTRSIDIFPTLVGLCGLALPDDHELEGFDLSEALLGRSEPPDLTSYSHTSLITAEQYEKQPGLTLRNSLHPLHDPRLMWLMVRDGDVVHKVVRDVGGEWLVQVFDWTRDPGETRGLSDPSDPEQVRAVDGLLEYQQKLEQGYPRDPVRLTPDERIERLRSLGYIN